MTDLKPNSISNPQGNPESNPDSSNAINFEESDLSLSARVKHWTQAKPVLWEKMTWPQIQKHREQGSGLVVLPIGATEQHGPHLPTGTDTIIAQWLCAYASAKTQVPILPALPITVSIGHTAKWDGTVSLAHQTFIEAIKQITDWLLAKGWSRALLVNSHFGNDASLRVAVDQLRTTYIGQLQIGLIHTYAVSDAVWQTFIEDADDLHANCAETDLLLFLEPQACDQTQIQTADDPDRTVDANGKACVFSYPVSQTSTNGVTGQPSLASAKRGEQLFFQMGDALVEKLERAKVEKPPLAFDSD